MKNKQLLLLVFWWAFGPFGAFAQCVIQVTDGQPYSEGFESGTMECWTVEATGAGNIDEVWVGNVTDDFVGEVALPVATVYPNPASDKALVSANITDGEVTLFDLSGRKMASATLHQGRVELDLSNFAQGVYMARIASKNGATTLRLIKE